MKWISVNQISLNLKKGTIGNLLTIIAIRRNRQMHTTFNGKIITFFPI